MALINPTTEYTEADAQRFAFRQLSRQLHTAVPGAIESYSADTRRARVHIAIRDILTHKRRLDRGTLTDVPVLWPAVLGWSFHAKITAGTPVMLLFSERSIANFKRSFNVSDGAVGVQHAEGDAVAICGFGDHSIGAVAFEGDEAFCFQNKAGTRFIVAGDTGLRFWNASKVFLEDNQTTLRWDAGKYVRVGSADVKHAHGGTSVTLNAAGYKAQIGGGSPLLPAGTEVTLTSGKAEVRHKDTDVILTSNTSRMRLVTQDSLNNDVIGEVGSNVDCTYILHGGVGWGVANGSPKIIGLNNVYVEINSSRVLLRWNNVAAFELDATKAEMRYQNTSAGVDSLVEVASDGDILVKANGAAVTVNSTPRRFQSSNNAPRPSSLMARTASVTTVTATSGWRARRPSTA